MAEPHIQDPEAKRDELSALVGREATITSVRHGEVQTFEGTLSVVKPFSHIRLRSWSRKHDGGAPIPEGRGMAEGPLRTLNFLGDRSAVRSLTVDGEVVYENPYLPDTYGAEKEQFLPYRDQMFGEYDLQFRG